VIDSDDDVDLSDSWDFRISRRLKPSPGLSIYYTSTSTFTRTLSRRVLVYESIEDQR